MRRPQRAAGITVARQHLTALVAIEAGEFEICWGTTLMVVKVKHRAKRTVKRSGRVYRRDAKGRFAASGTTSEVSTEAANLKRLVRRRRAVVAGTAAVTALAASQVHPASRTRTGITRRRMMKRHVARVASDHRKSVTRRARALPHRATSGAAFPKSARRAATAEARKLTKGYRHQLKRARKARRRSG